MPNLAELSRLDPTKLHAWAKRFHWDGDLFGPTLALRNPRCALGTALLLYWRGKPHFYRQWSARKDVPPPNREAFDLLRSLEKALRAGACQPRGIVYDPRDDGGADLTTIDYPEHPKLRDLPPETLAWTDGKAAHPLDGGAPAKRKAPARKRNAPAKKKASRARK